MRTILKRLATILYWAALGFLSFVIVATLAHLLKNYPIALLCLALGYTVIYLGIRDNWRWK